MVRLRQGYGGQPSWLASRSDKAAKAGGASRDRTDDLKLAKLALSQLSYGPEVDKVDTMSRGAAAMVGREGVEPSTSRLSGVRSNHLSYRPPRHRRPGGRGRREPAQASLLMKEKRFQDEGT